MLTNCQMNETKLEVSEGYEETELSDIDDDIFVRTGGKNGFRLEFNDISKKPLMTPRKKKGSEHLVNGFHTEIRSSPPSLRILCMPICYIIIATFAMLGLIAVIAFLSHYVPVPKALLRFFNKTKFIEDVNLIAPCDKIQVKDVWVKEFPKLLTESAFRTLDINSDGVDDIIFGFATGADGYNVPKFVCDIYFQSQFPCFGGVLALNGKDGSEIWRHWTEHEVFALNCNEDISKDGIADCLVSGRAGVFCAISGKDGTSLWTFSDDAVKNPVMNIYTAQYVRDLNGDGILDVLAIHGGDPLQEPGSKTRLTGRLVLLDGKTGQTLQWIETPDKKESYYSPQVITKSDGTDWVLFGTGGETHSGGLYIISMQDLFKGVTANIKTIYKDEKKGIMVPPVITDVNRDGVEDIVMAMFNSTVIAFDGNSYQQLWNHTFPSSETYTTPTPGYFNEDTIPDFLVKYQTGPGFPVYYHAQTTILDGKTGNPLLEKPIIDSIGSQASTPLIRVQGYGNDIFLYWSSNCKGFEGNSTRYKFAEGINVHEKTRSDFCKLRFGSTFVNQLRAFNQATGLPGVVIYDSESRNVVEHEAVVDTSQEGQVFLQKHPEMWQYYGRDTTQEYPDTQNPQDSMINGAVDRKEQMGRQIPSETYDPTYKLSPSQLQFMNRPYNIPLQQGYDIPQFPLVSQPELTENIRYPPQHNVRKHGKGIYYPPEASDINNIPISISRRGRLQTGLSDAYGRMIEPSNLEMESQGQRDEKLSPSFGDSNGEGKDSYYTNAEDAQNENRFSYDRRTKNPIKSESKYSPWGYSNGLNSRMRRTKRHIGPHDIDGIQRLISTGILAKPLNTLNTTSSSSADVGIDLIFATYWFYPAKTEVITFKSGDCIQKKLLDEKLRFDETSKYYGMDHDLFEDTVTNECKSEFDMADQETTQTERQNSADSSDSATSNAYESQSTYNPFDIHMGQMTVYRIHISCSCSEAALISKDGRTRRRCGKILEDQPWNGYMGSHSDSYFPFHAPISPTTPSSTNSPKVKTNPKSV